MPLKFEYDQDILDTLARAIKKNRRMAEEIKKRISSSISGNQEVRIEVGQNFISVDVPEQDDNPFVKSVKESELHSPRNIGDHFFSSHEEPSTKVRKIITDVMREIIPKDDS